MLRGARPTRKPAGGAGERSPWRDLPGLLALACLIPIAGIVVWLSGRPLATDDFWYHLKLGEVYAERGPWVDSDPMLFTASDRPSVPHEWLFQVALHAVWQIVGFHGLRAIHAGAVVALLGILYALFRRTGGSRAMAALATALFAVLAWFRLFQLRPDLFSIGAVLALHALLLGAERPPGRGRVALALLLLLVWANAHTVFAVGLALLLAALLGLGLEAALGRRLAPGEPAPAPLTPRARALAAALGLGTLLTLANPRGIAQHSFFFDLSGSGKLGVLADEFQRFDPFAWPVGNLALTPLAWLAALLVLTTLAAAVAQGLVRFGRERSRAALLALDPVYLGLAAAGAVAMVSVIRFLWLSIFPLLYLLRWQRRALASSSAARAAAWLAAATCAALALAFPGAIQLDAFAREVASEPGGYWRSAWLDERYCGAGMRFLRHAGVRGRLFHSYHVGPFLGYWLAPRLRTFVDGRHEQLPSEVWRDYLRLGVVPEAEIAAALRELLEAWRVDAVLGLHFPGQDASGASWIPNLRRSPEWIPAFVAEHCAVYLHRARGSEGNLERVRAYYEQRGIPFDAERGLDASDLIRRKPAWARRQGILPEEYAALEAARRRPDPAIRRAALERLGLLYWRIGAFREGVEVDRELVASEPASDEARRRLADGLLQLGRPAEALEVADVLYRRDPDHEDIAVIRRIAQERLQGQSREAPRERESEGGAAASAEPRG